MKMVIDSIGVSSVEALKPVVAVEKDDVATGRAEQLIVGFGQKAVSRLASLTGDSRWFVQRAGRGCSGAWRCRRRAAAAAAAAPERSARGARSGLGAGRDPDPAAARAIQTVLRAATGDVRAAVIEALVAERDPRVVPMLVRILEESEPLGKDHDVVVETIDALGTVGTDGAVRDLAEDGAAQEILRRQEAAFAQRA